MRLADLQAAYRGYLLSGDSTELAPAIVADSFDGPERLAIYRNNFLLSLGEALKANFPVTLQMLGGEFFEAESHHLAHFIHAGAEHDVERVVLRFPEVSFRHLCALLRS